MTTQIEEIIWHSADEKPKADDYYLAQSDDGLIERVRYGHPLEHGKPVNIWIWYWYRHNMDKHCYERRTVVAWAKVKGWQE